MSFISSFTFIDYNLLLDLGAILMDIDVVKNGTVYRKCCKCSLPKEISCFGREKNRYGNTFTRSTCKECRKPKGEALKRHKEQINKYQQDPENKRTAQVSSLKRMRTEKGRLRRKFQKIGKNYPASLASRGHEWERKNRERANVATNIYRKIKAGKITKPTHCPECQKLTPTKNMQVDIDENLDFVGWLCSWCKGERRIKNNMGLNNGPS